MSQFLAPYNNSMRLGQGFNSYTQQICLDRAVLPLLKHNPQPKGITTISRGAKDGAQTPTTSDGGNPVDTGDLKAVDYEPQPQGSEPPTPTQVMPWVKPQIVTYSSRFVDKISDVTDAMNISGSLSIKTATIGGKANGSYVDSDKFKSSDINFHLQVKVTNQIHEPPEYCIFNKISKVKKEEFAEVYGDCFISGWEEGGELNAVISMKVHDKSKVFEIKAGLEAEMSTPTISGKIEADFGMEKKNLSRSTETTISVNWSGGGSIKDPTVDWGIDSLKKAAAAFPDLVAVTPQRTYAILTKYSALADFQLKKDDFSPLDYESAGIYTSSLLDHYMDYKSMWKQISHATYELKGNRATIEMAQPDEETHELATIKPLPAAEVDAKTFKPTLDLTPSNSQAAAKQQSEAQALIVHQENCLHEKQEKHLPASIQFPVFHPTFAGLIHARKVCRFEMAKIVNEVDLVAKNPKLATDTTRDSFFLNPLVFEQLLPVVRLLSPESAKLHTKDHNAALLLGYVPPPEEPGVLAPVYILDGAFEKHDLRLQDSIQRCRWKSRDYLMQGCAGLHGENAVHSRAELKNDLVTMDATFRPKLVSVWSANNVVFGIQVDYANGAHNPHGSCVGDASHVWELTKDGSEVIVEVVVREGIDVDGQTVIRSISFVTSNCQVFDTSVKQDKSDQPASSPPPATTKETKAIEDKNGETKTTDGQPAIQSKAEEPAPTSPGSPPTLTKSTTFLRPDGGHWSLRGFFTFSQKTAEHPSGALCTLGVVWSKETFVPIPAAAQSPPICKSFLSLGPKLQENVRRFKTLKEYASYADKFLLGMSAAAEAGDTLPVDDTVTPFNALDTIDLNWTIRSITFASKEGKLTGLKVLYTNGQELKHGNVDREVWTCEVKSDLVIAKLTAGRATQGGPGFIDTIEFIRADEGSGKGEQALWPLDVSTLRYLGEGNVRVGVDVDVIVEKAPNFGGNARWTIRGFYGEYNAGAISRLGVVWGRG
ncbi:hypothetical protein HJFPF1_05429 [Paramyrothecium foliicola]|nr:hypothetical protein HJFPF1_05429 [Paramyrothecium foliicola]